MRNGFKYVIAAGLALACGCTTPTTMIDEQNDTGRTVAGFDYRDINKCIGESIASLLASGRLQRNDGSRYIVNVQRVVNDTSSLGRNADALSDVLTEGLKEELMNSGKAMIYNEAVGSYARAVVPPQLVLLGRITERNLRMDSGDIQKEYFLNLNLVEISTGVEFWQKRSFVGKRTDKTLATW